MMEPNGVDQRRKRKTFADSFGADGMSPTTTSPQTPMQGGWGRGWGGAGGPTPILPPQQERPARPQPDGTAIAPRMPNTPGLMFPMMPLPSQPAPTSPAPSTPGAPTPMLPPPTGHGPPGGGSVTGPQRPPLQPGQLPPPPLLGEADEFAREGLRNPSRWDAPMMQQGANVINQMIGKMRGEGMQSLDEQQSMRGILGSSMEQEQDRSFESDLQGLGMERLFNLQREAANTYAGDRDSAFRNALGSLGFGRQLNRDEEDDERFDQGFGFNERQFDADERAREWMRDIDILRLLGIQ